MHDRLKPLLSWPFIICLAVLLANDLYLKEAYHNEVTGKLSDICGLFIFPIFWSAIFPKHKLWVFLLSGVLFIYWKSPLAAQLISFLSTYFFSVQRTVDLTDLMALPALGLAWWSMKVYTKPVVSGRSLQYVAPYLIATLALFSFCATSQPQYVQTFDQPQYILFRSDVMPEPSSIDESFKFYQFDSLLVVQVDQLYTSDRPARNDDHNKNLSLKDFDKNVQRIIPGIKKMMPVGKLTTLTIKTAHGNDHAIFNGGRLHGRFFREKDGKVIIEGYYRMGVEDSIWTFRNAGNAKLTKMTFVNGERTKVQQYDGADLTSSSNINTRADVIRYKYVQIAVLVLLTIGAIILIVKNYRSKDEQQLQVRTIWKWLMCMILPVVVWLLQLAFTLLLGDLQYDMFMMVATMFVVFAVTCPLFFIIVFAIKLSKQADIIWYCLVFAFAFSIWVEYDVLEALIRS